MIGRLDMKGFAGLCSFIWVRLTCFSTVFLSQKACSQCSLYYESAIFCNLGRVAADPSGRGRKKMGKVYIIYIYHIHTYIHIFCLRILLQSSSCQHGAFSACKGCAWHFPIRMVTSHWHPRWWNRRTGHDRTCLDIFSGVRFEFSLKFSDVQWHQWLSQQHCSLMRTLFYGLAPSWWMLVDFPDSEASWIPSISAYPRCPWQLLPLCPDSKPESQSGFSKNFPVHNVLYDAIL